MFQLPIKISIASQIALNLFWKKQKLFWEKQGAVNEVFY